jgi:hypothetical protein
MNTDAVITYLEVQVEAENNPYGSYVCMTFVDIYPMFPKIDNTIKYIKSQMDLNLINYNYSFEQITEKTDITQYEITRH